MTTRSPGKTQELSGRLLLAACLFAFSLLACAAPACASGGCGADAFQATVDLIDTRIAYVSGDATAVNLAAIAELELKLEALRQWLDIPGMSCAVVKDQEILWARGFGCANIEDEVRATPNTTYHLASLTKPFGATVFLQLVEEGLVNLDDPISRFGLCVGERRDNSGQAPAVAHVRRNAGRWVSIPRRPFRADRSNHAVSHGHDLPRAADCAHP